MHAKTDFCHLGLPTGKVFLGSVVRSEQNLPEFKSARLGPQVRPASASNGRRKVCSKALDICLQHTVPFFLHLLSLHAIEILLFCFVASAVLK
jgi:hypothetical protein